MVQKLINSNNNKNNANFLRKVLSSDWAHKKQSLSSIVKQYLFPLYHVDSMLHEKKQCKKWIFSGSLSSSYYYTDRGFILTMLAGDLLFCCWKKQTAEKGFWNGNCDIYWVIILHCHLQEAGGGCLPLQTDGSPAVELFFSVR